MLECIHREQQDTLTRLKELECHFLELEAIIQRGKQQAVCEDEEVSGNGWGGAERCLIACPAVPTLNCFTGPTVLCRATNMKGTASTCRSSVSPAGNPSIRRLPCATWSTASPRLEHWLGADGADGARVFLAGWGP